VEDQAEARLLGVVEAEHLAEQQRAERAHGDAERYAGPLAAEGQELHREPGGRPVLADALRPRLDLVAVLAGNAEARQVALDVGSEDGYVVGAELLGQQLEGLERDLDA
jgi:hypothetical protein